ncbi:MAG: ABC transporter permease [Armatimonadetes bacterium]|nr:ABC transporter permease [Anaerolineae bacterium]
MVAQTQRQAVAGSQRRRQLILTLSRVWALAFLASVVLFFTLSVSLSTDGRVNFFTLRNSQSILVAITPVLLMGLGQTFVIISGGIDLSVGWTMGMTSVVAALVVRDSAARGLDPWLAVLLAFVVGLAAAGAVGLCNGLIIARLKVPPFIVTLGVSFVMRGLGLLFSGGQTVGGLPTQIRDLGNEGLLYFVGGDVGRWYVLQRPVLEGAALRTLDRVLAWPVVITVIVTLIMIFVLHKTQFGRHTYAIGGSREASLRAGIPVDRHTIVLYMLSAMTAGLAGILHTARFSGGSANAGDPLLLGSIAAVVIGGASLFGGVGQVGGTIIGALIIAVLQTGLVMLNVDPFWQYIVVGVVVILAVLIDQSRDLIIGRAEAG